MALLKPFLCRLALAACFGDFASAEDSDASCSVVEAAAGRCQPWEEPDSALLMQLGSRSAPGTSQSSSLSTGQSLQGEALVGLGPLVETRSAKGGHSAWGTAPVAWTFSGGGFRSTAAQQGFAHALAQVGLFDSDLMAAMGGNSGGTWFLTRFAYDRDYFTNLTQADRSSFEAYLLQVWGDYTGVITTLSKAASGDDSPTVKVLEALEVLAKQLKSTSLQQTIQEALLMYGVDFVWRSFIQHLYPEAIGNLAATTANRHSLLQGPYLHLQISGLTNTLQSSDATASGVAPAWGIDASGNAVALQNGQPVSLVPKQWIVPGTVLPEDRNTISGMFSPEAEGADYADMVGINTQFIFDPGFLQGMAKPTFDNESSMELPTNLSVEQVGAMSSAAVGILASPLTMLQVIAYELNKTVHIFPLRTEVELALRTPLGNGVTLKKVFEGSASLGPGMNNLAVCGHPVDGTPDDCDYPNNKFMDGGATDGLSLGMTVAKLQQRASGKRLRVLMSNQNSQESGQADFSFSFQREGAVGPGEYEPTANKGGIVRATPQVFSASWSAIESQFVVLGQFGKDGARQVKYAKVKTTTVHNPTYGVAGGTHADVLLLWVEGPEDMLMSSKEQYADLASAASVDEVGQLVDAWLKETAAEAK